VDLPSFFALLTEAGQQALAAAVSLEPAEANYLADFQHLSRSFGLDLSQAALETAIFRREAAAKFSTASHMYFTRPALEQATSEQVSVYRARRFAGFELLVDLGCSIGGDLFALARTAPALGIDLDPLRLAMRSDYFSIPPGGVRGAGCTASRRTARRCPLLMPGCQISLPWV
jgi:hypothetical protein